MDYPLKVIFGTRMLRPRAHLMYLVACYLLKMIKCSYLHAFSISDFIGERRFALIASIVHLVAFIVSSRYDLKGKKNENGMRTRKIQNEQCGRDDKAALNPFVANGLDIRSPF